MHIRFRLLAALTTIALLGLAIAWSQSPDSRDSEAAESGVANQVSIKVRGNYRYIDSNGIPDHAPGKFPNRGNPNSIRAQQHHFRMPVDPATAAKATAFGLGLFGIAVNGVPFDPGAAEFWNRDFRSGWQYEALSGKINLGMDANNAHVQPSGSYHYHGLPLGLMSKLSGHDLTAKGAKSQKMLLVGYAADGFPIYARYGHRDPQDSQSEIVVVRSSYRLKRGTRPNGPRGTYDGTFVQDYEYTAKAGDLDDANGRQGVTPEYPQGTYHYFLTDEFPFIPRMFRGTPDESFRRGPGPGGGPGGGVPRPGGRGRPPGPPTRGFPPRPPGGPPP